jgi:hypothetical protein
MKHLKIAGLCLAAMWALGLATTATASAAAPVWETCATEKAEKAATKYTTGTCMTASGSGKWAWQEIPASSPRTIVLRSETVTLKDVKTVGGEAEVRCVDEGTGKAGGSVATIESLTLKSCTAVKVCENVEEVKPLHLPWKTEFFETENRVEQTLKADGAGEPGWSVKCKTLLGSKTDSCEREEVAAAIDHNDIPRVTENEFSELEWLVLEFFDPYTHWSCSEGGKEAGRIGIVEAWLRIGGQLRVIRVG